MKLLLTLAVATVTCLLTACQLASLETIPSVSSARARQGASSADKSPGIGEEEPEEEECACEGAIDWESGTTYRPGTTVHHKTSLWQTGKWTKGEPKQGSNWKVIASCLCDDQNGGQAPANGSPSSN